MAIDQLGAEASRRGASRSRDTARIPRTRERVLLAAVALADREGIAALTDEAKRMGAVLSEETIAKFGAFDDL